MKFSAIFLLYGFALDRIADHVVFTSIRIANIYIADFAKSNFMQNTGDVNKCDPMHDYTLESHVYHHVYDVKIGLLISFPLSVMASSSPSVFGKIYELISESPVDIFGELSATPAVFQPIYGIVYEKPHTIMHMVDSFKPYYDILVDNRDPKCMIDNSMKEIDHEFLFIKDYYSAPIKMFNDFYSDSTTNDLQTLY